MVSLADSSRICHDCYQKNSWSRFVPAKVKHARGCVYCITCASKGKARTWLCVAVLVRAKVVVVVVVVVVVEVP